MNSPFYSLWKRIFSLLSLLIVAYGQNFPLDMKGQHLVIITIKNPLARSPTSLTLASGLMEAECLPLLSDSLHFTYEILVPDVLEYGTELKNGTWTAAMGSIQRKEADMLITFSPPSADKNQVADTSYPVFFDDTSIVMPYPEVKSSRFLAIWAPFTQYVWILFLLSMLVTPVVFWFVCRVADRMNASKNPLDVSLVYCYFFYLEMFISRRAVYRREYLAFQIVCLGVMFASFILGILYSTIYTSILAVPIQKPLIRSIEDVATDLSVKAYAYRASPTLNYIESSTDGTLKTIRNQLRKHPERKIPGDLYTDDLSHLVNNYNVLIIPTSNALSIVQQSYEKNHECRITIAEKPFYSRTQCITYPKNSPWTKTIDLKLLLLHQSGLLDHAFKKVSATSNPCLLGKKMVHNDTKTEIMMKLPDFVGIFIAMAAGITLSFVTLVCEWATKFIQLKTSVLNLNS